MTLVVDNKDITKGFILYIKKRMLGYVAMKLDVKKLIKYDEYFNSNTFKLGGKTKISSKKVILLGITNLSHKRYEATTHIFINPNINYPGTPLKVVDLCKMINFGTLSIDGYPIFTNTFNHFSKNIKKYMDRCSRGLG